MWKLNYLLNGYPVLNRELGIDIQMILALCNYMYIEVNHAVLAFTVRVIYLYIVYVHRAILMSTTCDVELQINVQLKIYNFMKVKVALSFMYFQIFSLVKFVWSASLLQNPPSCLVIQKCQFHYSMWPKNSANVRWHFLVTQKQCHCQMTLSCDPKTVPLSNDTSMWPKKSRFVKKL